ncbi:hypothetical protein C8J56DRAFT_193856 [Mycena floridula]|nr:hypothetical protein C8J56DRAFT_193856 [Mycena floridula]
MPGLAALPVEILLQISSHASRQDLKHFRLTCSSINCAAESHLFSILRISSRALQTEIYSTTLLQYLATTDRISKHVRALEIDTETFDTVEWGRDTLSIWQAWVEPAIRALHRVHSVRWVALSDPMWAHTSIMSALVSLQHLTALDIRGEIDLHDERIDPDHAGRFSELHKLQYLTNLQLDICIFGATDRSEHLSSPPPLSAIQTSLKQLLPQLVSLTLFEDPGGERDFSILFDSASEVFRLNTLSLRGWALGPLAASRLRSLNTLDLRRIHSTPISTFWSILASEGVLLRDLRASEVEDSLLEYLSSYAGLQKLYLIQSRGLDLTRESSWPRFITTVLSRHFESLLELTIRCTIPWPVDQSVTMKSIALCKNLRSLHILPMPEPGQQDSLTNYILNSISVLPQLTYLRLQSPRLLPYGVSYPVFDRAIQAFGPILRDTYHPFLRIETNEQNFHLDYTEVDNWTTLMFRQRPSLVIAADQVSQQSIIRRYAGRLRELLGETQFRDKPVRLVIIER